VWCGRQRDFEKGGGYRGEYGYCVEYSGVVFGKGCKERDEGGVEVIKARGQLHILGACEE
jgi:hypothetical protein